MVPMLPLLPKMNFPMDAPPDKALAEFLFFCRIRGRGKVKFSLWLLRVKRTDKVDKIDKVDVVGRGPMAMGTGGAGRD